MSRPRLLPTVALAASVLFAAPALAQDYVCQVQPEAGAEASLIPMQFLLQYSGTRTVTVTHPWIDGATVARQVTIRGTGGTNRINYSPGSVPLRNGDLWRINYQMVHTPATGAFEVGVRSSDARGRLHAAGACRPR